MITVNNLTKTYGAFFANDNISLVVPDGEITVMLGPNGAGKSTAIKSIMGLLRFVGNITVNGKDNKSEEAKRDLGYVPEMPAVYDMLTVYEHMEFVARAYKLEAWEERAIDLLTRFELIDKKDKLGKELSKGMQQKVSLCVSLLTNPKALIFDEPFVGLDPHAIKELKNLFLEEKAKGHSILISTHMLDSVSELWDRAFIMVNGEVAAIKERENESSTQSLEELFFSITEGKDRE